MVVVRDVMMGVGVVVMEVVLWLNQSECSNDSDCCSKWEHWY